MDENEQGDLISCVSQVFTEKGVNDHPNIYINQIILHLSIIVI